MDYTALQVAMCTEITNVSFSQACMASSQNKDVVIGQQQEACRRHFMQKSVSNIHLCGREESGPQASREEDGCLLSLGDHLPGDGCIYLSHTQGHCWKQDSAFQQQKIQLLCRKTKLMLAMAWHAAAKIEEATLATEFAVQAFNIEHICAYFSGVCFNIFGL